MLRQARALAEAEAAKRGPRSDALHLRQRMLTRWQR
jgi:hypothetical protein